MTGSGSARAAVLTDFGEPLDIDDVRLASPFAREVVIRTHNSGICHSDRSAQLGLSPRALTVPAIIGHEVSGVVERAGAGVTTVHAGDHVVACAAASCGGCAPCLRGHEELCVSTDRSRDNGQPARITLRRSPVAGFVGIGGFASRILVHEQAVVPIPSSMPLDLAAILGCAVHTGIGAVRQTACGGKGRRCRGDWVWGCRPERGPRRPPGRCHDHRGRGCPGWQSQDGTAPRCDEHGGCK